MKKILINASQAEELRVALVLDHTRPDQKQQGYQEMYDLIIERPGFEQKTGNIYKGIITSVELSLNAAFVNYGAGKHGFLPFDEISPECFLKPFDPNSHHKPDYRELLKVGQELIVRLEKEERSTKGAALTTYISLPGSFLVLMPNNPRAGGVTRQLDAEDRDELRDILNELNIPADMGLIIRTAGVGRSKEDLQWELDLLVTHWNSIKAAAEARKAPFLIHQEGSATIRAVRDYLRADIAEVIIDNEQQYEEIKDYLQQIRPEYIERLKLYKGTTPLFSRYEIEHQIETAFKRTVRLPSGGTIDIDHTEALVAIDINSGRATKGGNIEETAFNTNLEAAREIARQLRLRDIGGLIVIDFIDMTPVRHQREVENTLINALKVDRARVQINKISRFGLLEMSRQRLRPSLREAMQHVCTTCNGHGSIRSVESIAISLFRIIQEEANKQGTAEIFVQASRETATYLLNEKRNRLTAVEQETNCKIIVIPNPNLQCEDFQIKRARRLDNDVAKPSLSSYEMIEKPEVKPYSEQKTEHPHIDKPAVRQTMPQRTEKSSAPSLIKRLWTNMFGQNETSPSTSTTQASKTPRQPSHSSATRRPRTSGQSESTSRRDTQRRQPSGDNRGRSNTRPDSRSASDNRAAQDGRRQPQRRQAQADSATPQAPKKAVDKPTRPPRGKENKPEEYQESFNEYVQDKKRVEPAQRPARPANVEQKPIATIVPENATPVVIRAHASTDVPVKVSSDKSPRVSAQKPVQTRPLTTDISTSSSVAPVKPLSSPEVTSSSEESPIRVGATRPVTQAPKDKTFDPVQVGEPKPIRVGLSKDENPIQVKPIQSIPLTESKTSPVSPSSLPKTTASPLESKMEAVVSIPTQPVKEQPISVNTTKPLQPSVAPQATDKAPPAPVQKTVPKPAAYKPEPYSGPKLVQVETVSKPAVAPQETKPAAISSPPANPSKAEIPPKPATSKTPATPKATEVPHVRVLGEQPKSTVLKEKPTKSTDSIKED